MTPRRPRAFPDAVSGSCLKKHAGPIEASNAWGSLQAGYGQVKAPESGLGLCHGRVLDGARDSELHGSFPHPFSKPGDQKDGLTSRELLR